MTTPPVIRTSTTATRTDIANSPFTPEMGAPSVSFRVDRLMPHTSGTQREKARPDDPHPNQSPPHSRGLFPPMTTGHSGRRRCAFSRVLRRRQQSEPATCPPKHGVQPPCQWAAIEGAVPINAADQRQGSTASVDPAQPAARLRPRKNRRAHRPKNRVRSTGIGRGGTVPSRAGRSQFNGLSLALLHGWK